MADARKRARRGGAETPHAEPPSPVPPPEPQVVPATPQGWESREEALVFPADPPSPGGARIELPSSGTAEEILARADAMRALEVPAASPAVVAPEPPVPRSEAAARSVSFFSTASSREEKKTVEATEHLATFYLEREEYGVDVRMVQEIIRITEITPVPRAPEFIRGVINLRGRIIPVVDLKRKLGLGAFERQKAARIVVVKLRDRLLGLLVDAASQVLKVPVAVIEAAPDEVVEIDHSYIRGVAKLERRLIILLDLGKVLALELREAKGESS